MNGNGTCAYSGRPASSLSLVNVLKGVLTDIALMIEDGMGAPGSDRVLVSTKTMPREVGDNFHSVRDFTMRTNPFRGGSGSSMATSVMVTTKLFLFCVMSR